MAGFQVITEGRKADFSVLIRDWLTWQQAHYYRESSESTPHIASHNRQRCAVPLPH